MQFDEAGTIVRRVKWFFCAPGAKTLPVPNAFCSANYGKVAGGVNGVGEVWDSTRPYSLGERPPTLTGQREPCGPIDWFTHGVPTGTPPLRMVGDVPACCGLAGYPGSIGIKVGPSESRGCGVGISLLGTSLNCLFGHFPPSAFQSFCDSLWYVDRGARGFMYFEAFHQDGCTGCLRGNWASNGLYFNGNFEGPFLGYWMDDPHVLAFRCDVPLPMFKDTIWLVTLPLPAQLGRVGVKVGLAGNTSLVIERCTIGLKAGLESATRTRGPGTVGIKVGLLSADKAVYLGNFGAQAGVESEVIAAIGVELGLLVGLESSQIDIVAGQLGVMAGIAGSLVAVQAGSVGVKAGVDARTIGRLTGALGAKAGLASSLHVYDRVALGAKAGLASSLHVYDRVALGVKAGLASSAYPGTPTSCCPGNVVPFTLTAQVNGGTAFTMTYNSGPNSWTGVNPDDGFGWSIACVPSGATFVWQASVTPSAHCTQVRSALSVTCFPFSFSQHLVVTGGLCGPAGTYTITAHA